MPSGAVVRLQFIGFAAPGTAGQILPSDLMVKGGDELPIYVFSYVEPPDPYRDLPRTITRQRPRGFAFSVYHPCTDLPQMPWAL